MGCPDPPGKRAGASELHFFFSSLQSEMPRPGLSLPPAAPGQEERCAPGCGSPGPSGPCGRCALTTVGALTPGEDEITAWECAIGTRFISVIFLFSLLRAYRTASWALQTADGRVGKLESELHPAQDGTAAEGNRLFFFSFFLSFSFFLFFFLSSYIFFPRRSVAILFPERTRVSAPRLCLSVFTADLDLMSYN